MRKFGAKRNFGAENRRIFFRPAPNFRAIRAQGLLWHGIGRLAPG
jgi:hypothetical protein